MEYTLYHLQVAAAGAVGALEWSRVYGNRLVSEERDGVAQCIVKSLD